MTRTNEHGQPIGEPVSHWQPRPRPAPVTLEGRFVRLEPLTVSRAEAILQRLQVHPEVWTYLGDEPPSDPAGAATRMVDEAELRGEVVFAVCRRSDDSVQGTCRLMRTDEAHGVTEVGAIAYSPELQRTPATTEATYLLACHVFDELGYRRFEWKLDSLNAPSAVAARRLGFRYEGRFRNAVVYKGRNRDTDWFAMTDDDWRTLRPAYDAWLDPSNFDADGQQLTRLSDLTGAG